MCVCVFGKVITMVLDFKCVIVFPAIQRPVKLLISSVDVRAKHGIFWLKWTAYVRKRWKEEICIFSAIILIKNSILLVLLLVLLLFGGPANRFSIYHYVLFSQSKLHVGGGEMASGHRHTNWNANLPTAEFIKYWKFRNFCFYLSFLVLISTPNGAHTHTQPTKKKVK